MKKEGNSQNHTLSSSFVTMNVFIKEPIKRIFNYQHDIVTVKNINLNSYIICENMLIFNEMMMRSA